VMAQAFALDPPLAGTAARALMGSSRDPLAYTGAWSRPVTE
jgi:hypothetical protein